MHACNSDLGAARAVLVDILYRRAFLLSVPLAPLRERNHASDQRKAQRLRQLDWISPEDALHIGGVPYDLEVALRSGRVRCRFYASHRGAAHTGHWWQWNEAKPREAIHIGSNGRSLVDSEYWVLRVNGADWCARRRPAEHSLEEPSSAVGGASQAATQLAPETAPTPLASPPTAVLAPIGEKGGRPSDRDRIVAEAERRVANVAIANATKESLPRTLAEFATQIGKAIRTKAKQKTIERHVRPIWANYRKS